MTELNIPEGLLAWSTGITADRAAVGLLLDHGTWLTRDDFLDQCVIPVPEKGLAALDWGALEDTLDTNALTATGAELAILRLVASIGYGHPVDLGEAMSSLDSTNAGHVARAVLTAAGADLAAVARELADEGNGW